MTDLATLEAEYKMNMGQSGLKNREDRRLAIKNLLNKYKEELELFTKSKKLTSSERTKIEGQIQHYTSLLNVQKSNLSYKPEEVKSVYQRRVLSANKKFAEDSKAAQSKRDRRLKTNQDNGFEITRLRQKIEEFQTRIKALEAENETFNTEQVVQDYNEEIQSLKEIQKESLRVALEEYNNRSGNVKGSTQGKINDTENIIKDLKKQLQEGHHKPEPRTLITIRQQLRKAYGDYRAKFPKYDPKVKGTDPTPLEGEEELMALPIEEEEAPVVVEVQKEPEPVPEPKPEVVESSSESEKEQEPEVKTEAPKPKPFIRPATGMKYTKEELYEFMKQDKEDEKALFDLQEQKRLVQQRLDKEEAEKLRKREEEMKRKQEEEKADEERQRKIREQELSTRPPPTPKPKKSVKKPVVVESEDEEEEVDMEAYAREHYRRMGVQSTPRIIQSTTKPAPLRKAF